jgi:hypothetical protein
MRALSECGHRILIFLAHDPTSNSDTKKGVQDSIECFWSTAERYA